jgi:hypothetical protein
LPPEKLRAVSTRPQNSYPSLPAEDSRCRQRRELRKQGDYSQGQLQRSDTSQISNRAVLHTSHPTRHRDESGSRVEEQSQNLGVNQRLVSLKLQSGPSRASAAPRRHRRPEAETRRRAARRPAPRPRRHSRPGGARQDAPRRRPQRRCLLGTGSSPRQPRPSSPTMGAPERLRIRGPAGCCAQPPGKPETTT